jgi:membrane protein
MSLIKQTSARLRRLWLTDIWLAATAREKSLRGRLFAVLRVISITLSGLADLKVAARAAALSYSSLLALGPLVALGVLISGFALGDQDPVIMARSLNRVISFVAPQLSQYDAAGARSATPPAPPVLRAAPPEEAAAAAPAPDPELVRYIDTFIKSSRSGAAGAIGLLTLLFIVIQLFSSIENTFNDIWGVRRGRSLLTRIVYYWTAVTLGAVLFFTSVTLLSAGAFINVFFAKVPLGGHLKELFVFLLPSASALLLVLVLMLFYRSIPNTRVKWRAALIGAVVVAALLILNNTLAFLYFRSVVFNRSLYGSVGILPILMIGLYFFWFFVLVGGQITYAVQNVHYRSSQAAWHNVNEATRESLSLLLLVLIARRFRDCAAPYSVTQLSHIVRVPSQILNESLNRLCDLGLIAQLPPADDRDQSDYRFQPARPLEKITLLQFRELFENYGEAPSGELLDSLDPVLAYYHERLARALPSALGEQSLAELLDARPSTLTAVPFPLRTGGV